MQAGREWAEWLDEEDEDGMFGDSHIVLWSSGLSALPDPAQLPPFLSVLDLRYNKVRELPEDLKLLSNLQHLDLTCNCLESIPDSLWQLSKLRGLFLGRNELSALPETVGHLTNLEILRLDHNKLIELPWQLGRACRLEVLSITFNRITSLPCEMALLSSLQKLSIGGNPLVLPSASRARDVAPGALHQPRDAGFASDEREADSCFSLGRGSLSREGHDQLLGFLSLQLLAQDYSYRELTEVPQSALRVAGLQSLKLHNNKLRQLPEALGLLCALRVLDLAHNFLTSIPSALSTLTALQELNTADNLLANSVKAEKELGYDMCIPPALGPSLLSIQTLLLAGNQIMWMPPAVLQMPLLTLDLSHNRLRHLPEKPPECALAGALRLLHLGHNELRDVDVPLFHALSALEELILETNLLRKLPPCLGDLAPSMQLLWAGENRMEEVPAALGRLSNLRSLRLETNLLRTIPVELGQCTQLEDLNLFNNPSLYQPPAEVVVRGCLAIVSYLQRLLQAKCLRAPEVGGSDLDANAPDVKTADDSAGGPDRDEEEEDVDEEEEEDGRRRRPSGEGEDMPPPTATDVLGDTFLPAQAISEPKHAVRYLNQDCHLLKVYCEGDKVFVDLRVLESERLLVRIPEHMIS